MKKNVDGLNGFEVDGLELYYLGKACPGIEENDFADPARYNQGYADSWTTWQTPLGMVERHEWARGARGERRGTSWRLVPQPEVGLELEELQERFVLASRQLEVARQALDQWWQLTLAQARSHSDS